MAAQAEKKEKTCFVVGPIGDPNSDVRIHADWLLEEIIQPVFKDFPEYKVVRADQIAQPGMIDAQIIGHLIDADLVVADLSTLNPNAFYKIGIRHMVQKPIIHIQLAEDKIPFDVSLYRATKFSRIKPSDLREARDNLKRAVAAATADGYQVDNPVTRARGQIRLEERATPEEKVLLDQVRAIQSRLESIEEQISDSGEEEVSNAVKRSTRKKKSLPSGIIINLKRGNAKIDGTKVEVGAKVDEARYMYYTYADEIVVPGSRDLWESEEDLWKKISLIKGVDSVYFRD
jgi:hypothetical protein